MEIKIGEQYIVGSSSHKEFVTVIKRHYRLGFLVKTIDEDYFWVDALELREVE